MKNTKRFNLAFVLIALFSFALTLTSCVVDRSKVVYNVGFELDGQVLCTYEVLYANKLTEEQVPADPVKEGYDFLGWFWCEEEFDIDKGIRQNRVYSAKFQKKVLTVKFVIDGQEVANYEVNWGRVFNVELIPEAPRKNGMAFIGWEVDKTLYDFSQPVKESVVLTPRYAIPA